MVIKCFSSSDKPLNMSFPNPDRFPNFLLIKKKYMKGQRNSNWRLSKYFHPGCVIGKEVVVRSRKLFHMGSRNFLLIILFCIGNPVPLQAQVNGFKISNQRSCINKNQMVEIKRNGETERAYVTLEVIQYNFLNRKKTATQTELQNLVSNIYNNSTGVDSNAEFADSLIDSMATKIMSLKEDLRNIKTRQDSLYIVYTKDLLSYKNFIIGFSPEKSRAFFDMLYCNEGKRFKALGNAGINFGENTASIYSELVGGYLGLFRVSLGSLVSSNNNDSMEEGKEEEAYQRLITYGGNTVINFEYPLAYLHSSNNQYNLISRALLRGATDLPEFGTNTDKVAGSCSMGLDFYGDAAVSDNSLRFFFNFNINQLYGSSVFQENLGTVKPNFTFGQLSLGLVFLEKVKISFSIATFSSEPSLKNRTITAGGQGLR